MSPTPQEPASSFQAPLRCGPGWRPGRQAGQGLRLRLRLAALMLPAAIGFSLPIPVQASPPNSLAIGDEQAKRCNVPLELAPVQDPLPGLARALRDRSTDKRIVVLGPQVSGSDSPVPGVIGYPSRLQAQLTADLAAELGQRNLTVETVGKTRGSTGELAAMISKQVLPLKPALVIWQVGRADARRGNPPYRFASKLSDGIDTLRKQGIDTIVLDIQYHPQFEALYRTDEYRHHLRWLVGKSDIPLLRRYEMIEYWVNSGLIDLDSGNQDVQKTSFDFIQDCVAFQAARLIVNGIRLAPRK